VWKIGCPEAEASGYCRRCCGTQTWLRLRRNPPTFDFLGLTHICSRKKNGEFAIQAMKNPTEAGAGYEPPCPTRSMDVTAVV
jgi:hypothetical protein